MVSKFIGGIIFKTTIYSGTGTESCVYNDIVFQLPDSVIAGNTYVKIVIVKLQRVKTLNISGSDKL